MIASLTARAAAVEIAPDVGGAIASFRWRRADVLRPTGETARAAGNVRGFACYPLVPWSNRIANAMLRLRDGTTFTLLRNFGDHPHAIHGLGWQRTWHVARLDDAGALLTLRHHPDREEDAGAWPFAFSAAQAFTLHADAKSATLTLTLMIRNDDSRTFPFGLGWHPFFPRDAKTLLGFSATSVWETEATHLPTREVPIPDRWRFEPLRPLGDLALDHVFAGWDGTATLQWPRRRVTIKADRACAHLVVYVPAQHDFLAVEPVTHMTDAFNRAALGEPGTGTRWLEPQEARSCTMRIVVSSPD